MPSAKLHVPVSNELCFAMSGPQRVNRMIVLLENFASRQKYLPLNAMADKKNQITIPLWNILINNTRSKWVRISEENFTLFYHL